MSQNQEDLFRKKLAGWLGITFDELEEYAEDIEENNGDYGNLKFAYSITFSSETPQEILAKIPRITKQNMIFFNLEELA